jgi:hypothetical protein
MRGTVRTVIAILVPAVAVLIVLAIVAAVIGMIISRARKAVQVPSSSIDWVDKNIAAEEPK